MRRTVPPSAGIEARIDGLLALGLGEDLRGALSALAKLGARLIIQRTVEESSTPGSAGRATSAGRGPRRESTTAIAPRRRSRSDTRSS